MVVPALIVVAVFLVVVGLCICGFRYLLRGTGLHAQKKADQNADEVPQTDHTTGEPLPGFGQMINRHVEVPNASGEKPLAGSVQMINGGLHFVPHKKNVDDQYEV